MIHLLEKLRQQQIPSGSLLPITNLFYDLDVADDVSYDEGAKIWFDYAGSGAGSINLWRNNTVNNEMPTRVAGTPDYITWIPNCYGERSTYKPDFGNGNFTIKTWVKPIYAPNTYGGRAILGCWNFPQVAEDGFFLYITYASTTEYNLKFTYYDAVGLKEVTSSTTTTLGNWNQISVTRKDNVISILVNGVVKNTIAITTAIVTPTYSFRLAILNGLTDYSFNGLMNQVQFYSEGFTPADILGDFNIDKARFGL